MKAHKPLQMDFPTLPSDCVKYVWFNPKESEDDNKVFKLMKENYDDFIALAREYAKKSFEEMMLSRNYAKDRPNEYSLFPAEIKFMIIKKEKHFFMYHHFCGTFYARASSWANSIASFLIHAIAFQVPSSSNLDGFKQYIKDSFDDNIESKKDLRKYTSFSSHLTPILSKLKIKTPSQGELLASLEENSCFTNTFIQYCFQTPFDDILYKYLKNSQKWAELTDIALSIVAETRRTLSESDSCGALSQLSSPPPSPRNKKPKKRSDRLLNIEEIEGTDEKSEIVEPQSDKKRKVKSIDLSSFKKFIDIFENQFKNISEPSHILLVCSLYRLFFDLMYIHEPKILSETHSTVSFIKNCNNYRYMTPSELEITEGIFTELQKTQPFTKIDSSLKLFHDAVELIMMVQFFNNPIDLVYSLFQSMQRFDLIMKRNSLEPKMGSYISVLDEESIARLQIAMSFDDFFSIFYSAISVSPPSNPFRIRDFLVMFSGVKMTPPMTYAASLFSAGVSHLQSSSKTQNKTLNVISIESDPLNFHE